MNMEIKIRGILEKPILGRKVKIEIWYGEKKLDFGKENDRIFESNFKMKKLLLLINVCFYTFKCNLHTIKINSEYLNPCLKWFWKILESLLSDFLPF